MIDLVGWAGSALLVASLLQSGMLRLRVLNLIAAVILVGYNSAVATWPMVGMNLAVAAIDVRYIVRLRRETAEQAAGRDGVFIGGSDHDHRRLDLDRLLQSSRPRTEAVNPA